MRWVSTASTLISLHRLTDSLRNHRRPLSFQCIDTAFGIWLAFGIWHLAGADDRPQCFQPHADGEALRALHHGNTNLPTTSRLGFTDEASQLASYTTTCMYVVRNAQID